MKMGVQPFRFSLSGRLGPTEEGIVFVNALIFYDNHQPRDSCTPLHPELDAVEQLKISLRNTDIAYIQDIQVISKDSKIQLF